MWCEGWQQARLLGAVEGRGERSGGEVEYVVRRRLDSQGEIVAVGRLAVQELEHDEAERPREALGVLLSHGSRGKVGDHWTAQW
jgi:hypothetical protein